MSSSKVHFVVFISQFRAINVFHSLNYKDNIALISGVADRSVSNEQKRSRLNVWVCAYLCLSFSEFCVCLFYIELIQRWLSISFCFVLDAHIWPGDCFLVVAEKSSFYTG